MIDATEPFTNGFKTIQIEGIAWRVFATHGGERDVQVYVGEQVKSRASILWAVLRSMLDARSRSRRTFWSCSVASHSVP